MKIPTLQFFTSKVIMIMMILGITSIYHSKAQDLPDLTTESNAGGVEYLNPGDTLNVNSTANNIGFYAADESYVNFYLSTDNTYDASDVFLDSLRYGRIIGKSSKTNNKDLVIPDTTDSGTYHLISYIDKQESVDETNENNNTYAFQIDVANIDLTAKNIVINTTEPVSVLEDLEFDFDIVNDSSDFVPANYFSIYISEDTILDPGIDDRIRSSTEIQNAGGNTVSRSETLGVPDCLTDGDYYLLIEVDTGEDVSESKEDNNVVHKLIEIEGANTDLYGIHQGSANNNNYLENDVIDLSGFRIRAAGKTPASSSDVKVYLSSDDVLDAGDTEVHSEDGGELSCGEYRYLTGTYTVTALAVGKYYLIADIDPDDEVAEDDENNNTVSFYFWKADNINLSLSSCSVTPTTFDGSETFTISFDIKNTGTNTLGDISVDIEFEQSGEVSGVADVYSKETLTASELDNVSTTISSAALFDHLEEVDVLTDGDFKLKAYVGGQSDVQDECSSGSITVNLDVDYFFDDVTTKYDEYNAGDDISVTARVAIEEIYDFYTYANIDQDISFYLSDDETWDAGDDNLGTFTRTFDRATYTTYTETFTLDDPMTEGDYFVIVKIDEGNAITETDENNNEFVRPIYITGSRLWVGSVSSDWTVAGNWSGDAVPSTTDDVVIDEAENDPVISSTDTASCAVLTINADGSLTIKSDENGTGSLITHDSIANFGTFNIERYITDSTWHLISAPLNGLTANIFRNSFLQSWSETEAQWSYITEASTSLDTLNGYSLWSTLEDTAYTFTGTPFNGTLSVDVTYTNNGAAHDGANLLGNPYPSSIDWSRLDDTWGAVYYWDPSANGGAGDYLEWNNGAGSGSQYVPPMQGFFIVASAAGTFELTNSDRINEGNTTYYKSLLSEGLVLEALSNGKSDEYFLRFDPAAGPGFDLQYDAVKFFSGVEGVSQLYSYGESRQLAIDVRPETETIQLGYANDQTGVYSIGLKEAAELDNIFLEDTKTQAYHNLKKGNYEFAWDVADADTRFKLHLNAVGIDENSENSDLFIFAYDDDLYVRSNTYTDAVNLRVSDMQGRIVLEKEVVPNASAISTGLKSGVYLVSVVYDQQIKTSKIFIK